MNLAPFIDNERISTLLRAVRSGNEEWINDAATIARQETRLEAVVDAILLARPDVGQPMPLDVPTPVAPMAHDTTGAKGGEASSSHEQAEEMPPRRR